MTYTSSTALTSYFNNIKRFPVLTRKEEKSLIKKAQSGDEASKQKLILANLKFVVIIAKKYLNSGLPLADLISEGNLGLIKSIENFDADKGFHLISYAVHWIRQSIIKAIAEKSKIVRLPLSWNNNLYNINRKKDSIAKLDQSNINTISRELGINENKVNELLQLSKSHISLESQVNHNNEKVDLKNIIKDENSINPETLLMNKSIKKDVLEVLDFLSETERKVIIDRFGLKDNCEPKKLQEIGNELNLTKERIRQIEKKALEKLKKKVCQLEINYYLKD